MDVETLNEFNKTADGIFCNMKLESLNTVEAIDKFLVPVLGERHKCLIKFARDIQAEKVKRLKQAKEL